jgi:hypothetical protein
VAGTLLPRPTREAAAPTLFAWQSVDGVRPNWPASALIPYPRHLRNVCLTANIMGRLTECTERRRKPATASRNPRWRSIDGKKFPRDDSRISRLKESRRCRTSTWAVSQGRSGPEVTVEGARGRRRTLLGSPSRFDDDGGGGLEVLSPGGSATGPMIDFYLQARERVQSWAFRPRLRQCRNDMDTR